MKLTITTPTAVVVDIDAVLAVRAEDPSGWFGILPGHEDLLTALVVSVVTWHEAVGRDGHCAVRGGVFRVRDGSEVAVATREAVASDDLESLEHEVLARFRSTQEEELGARSGSTRLHVAAIQRLMGMLQPTGAASGLVGRGMR